MVLQRPTLDSLPFAKAQPIQQMDPSAVKDFAQKGQAKALQSETERGEASLAISVAKNPAVGPSGISSKRGLALAGSNIVSEKQSQLSNNTPKNPSPKKEEAGRK